VTTEHTSKQFDIELDDVKNSIIEMGGMAIKQFKVAMKSLDGGDPDLIRQVLHLGQQVNKLEVEIDRKCNLILAQRQPEANDLRRILTVLKITGDIERIGDQTELIIRRAETLLQQGGLKSPRLTDLDHCADLALSMTYDAMEAFSRSDADIAARVIKQDIQVNEKYDRITRRLIGHMLEDPGSITSALDFLFVAKAIERIGDHSKNIAEYVIFMVKGYDVRHSSIEQMENTARQP
jgi:phosphate transport system protein